MDINDKHLTVVFTINDKEAFRPELDKLMANFKGSEGEPWAITAISRDHEMRRLELIEEAVEARRFELIEELLGLVNLHKINSISDIP